MLLGLQEMNSTMEMLLSMVKESSPAAGQFQTTGAMQTAGVLGFEVFRFRNPPSSRDKH